MVQELIINADQANNDFQFKKLPISYQFFGQKLGTAPVVLVFHALTGNSEVAGEKGWWSELIGEGKCINLHDFTILTIDIPGNGYNGFWIDENYHLLSIETVANWFLEVLKQLNISNIYAGIGASLGGMLLWQTALLKPNLFKNIIPIAADWKTTDWILAQGLIQQQLLSHPITPLQLARMHAMTLYRTPHSFKARFNRRKKENMFEMESWLRYHGDKLSQRFHLKAYKLMNHLLMTAHIKTDDFYAKANTIQGNITLIGIDSDGLFPNFEIIETYEKLKSTKNNVSYHEIQSIHGHDAFLIETDQLADILQAIFNFSTIQKN